jgi:alpha 1,2-mannosyltransferase
MFASAGGYQTEGGESSLDFCGHSLVQWGLTPRSALHDPTYHPPPAFLHMILTKHRRAPLQPEKLFSHLLRPRLDGINDDRLVRTYYEWTGACFAITLKGPDGARGVDNSVGDGQGLVMQEMKDVLGEGKQWEELMDVARRFVRINQMEG